MRLIDADAFKEFLQALVKAGAPYEEVIKLLDREKTAYNVDKVVEKLVFQTSGLTTWAEDEAYKLGIEKAIEIVRLGCGGDS